MQNTINNSNNTYSVHTTSKPKVLARQADNSTSEERSQTKSELSELLADSILNGSNDGISLHEIIDETMGNLKLDLQNAAKPIKSYNLGLLENSSKTDFLPDLYEKMAISTKNANLLQQQISQLTPELNSYNETITMSLLSKSTELFLEAHSLNKLISDFVEDDDGEKLSSLCGNNQQLQDSEQAYGEIKNGYKQIQDLTKSILGNDLNTAISTVVHNSQPQSTLQTYGLSGTNDDSSDSDSSNTDSGYPTATVVEFIPGKSNIAIMLMNVCVTIAQNNYEAGITAASLVDILNESLAAVNALSAFLTTLNTFYQSVLTGAGAVNSSKEVDPQTVDFDDKLVYDTCKNDDADVDYYVTRSDGKNTLHLSPDEVPEDLQIFFKKDSDGNYMVTSDSIQDCVDYVSKMVAKVVPGCTGDASISSVYGDAAMTSSQVQGFINGLSTVTTQINQSMSNLTSDATTYADNAKSATDFLNQYISQSNQSKLY